MSSIQITLPDQSVKSFKKPLTGLELADSLGLKKKALAFLKKGKVYDLRQSIDEDSEVKILTPNEPESLEVLRHSAAHVLAQAVQELWPEVKVGIGPVIEDGFYYDFDTSKSFSPEDLEKIEKKINQIISEKTPVVRKSVSKEEAIKIFTDLKEDLKVEIIKDLDEKEVTIYHQGEWFDLCRGPHVQYLTQIPCVKLLSVAGAYWKGDQNNKQLQRIYGTSFFSKKDLNEHLKNLEEAKENDHRILGKKLNLFWFHEHAAGSPFFTEKGTVVYNELQNFIREKYTEYNYQEVITPQLFEQSLYETSGHYDNYRDNMYFTKQNEQSFSFKPMNCPGHCLLYSMKNKSYKDLPYKVADFGRLHRKEKSGTMHGLNRVKSFCQDDAHVFCSLDQVKKEVKDHLNFLDEVYQTLGMSNYKVYLSTRPEKRIGSDEVWDRSESILKEALEDMSSSYEISEGEGAFYGPKLDFVFIDTFKRPWQLGTFQCDFNLPERFNLYYKGEDNKSHRPVLLHRAVLGSLERFLGVYLEHVKGKLPLWLSPTQLSILNISIHQKDYCEKLYNKFKEEGFRVSFDSRDEKLNLKVRQAQLEKIPYMLVIGDKEKNENLISVRTLDGKTKYGLNLDDFIKDLKKQIKEKTN